MIYIDIHNPATLTGIFCIIGSLYLAIATYIYAEKQKDKLQKHDILKNALFTVALSIVYPHKIDHGNHNYDSYDGSMLPPLTGPDSVTACLTYMMDSDNPHNHSRYNAIHRFLHSHFPFENDDIMFVQEFIDILNSMLESDKVEVDDIDIDIDKESPPATSAVNANLKED